MAKKKQSDENQGEIRKLHLSEESIDAPKDSYVPEGFDTVEDYLDDLRETYEADLLFDTHNRLAALDDKKFVAGEQWDPYVLAQRAGLPCLTINTIPQFTAQLVGDWRENKNSVKVLPAENGDVDVANVRADLIRAIETGCRADRTYNSAFESMVQCGDGAFRVAVKYANEDVFDQDIVLEPIDDCLSVVWDRLSLDPTGRDATHCFVDDMMPTKEFKKKWPEADPSTLRDADRRTYLLGGWVDEQAVKVTEHWRLIERKRLLVMFEDGNIYPFPEDETPQQLEQYVQKHGKPVKSRVAPCTYAQMHLVTGYKILAGPYEWRMTRLPIIRMAGRVVTLGEQRYRYGLVRFMKDLVRLKNFWRSTAAEQLGYAPKAQWIATESAVEGKEDALRQAHMTRDPLLVVNDEAIIGQNIQRLEPPTMQAALLNEAQINTQDMKDVTGIHDASLGIKSNETSGRAIMARQREGDVASLTYYDNGNAALLEAGDVINQLIGQIYDGTRIIRIIGEDEQARLVKVNDPMDPNSPNLALGAYDVAISTGASYTTRRVEAAEAMMEAIQVYPQLMQIAGDLIVKAQDWPGSQELSERLQKTIPPQLLSDKEKQEAGDDTQQQMQQMMQQQVQLQEVVQKGSQELQKLQQENLLLKTKHDVEMRRLAIQEFEAETQRLMAYGQFAMKDKEFELRQLETQADRAMEEEETEHQHAVDHANVLLDAHDQMAQHDFQQQQIDNAQETAQQQAQDRDELTQLKIRSLSNKLSSDGSSTPQALE